MAPTRGRVQLQRRARAAAAEPGRPVRPRARPRRGPRGGPSRARPRRARRAQPPRPLVGTAPAPGARGRARRRAEPPRRSPSTSPPAGWTGPPSERLARVAVGAGRAGGAGAGRYPRRRVRGRIRHPRGAAGTRPPDRRRPRRTRCSPAVATSRPNRRASSAGWPALVRPEQAAAVLEARRAAIADSGGQISSLAGAGR